MPSRRPVGPGPALVDVDVDVARARWGKHGAQPVQPVCRPVPSPMCPLSHCPWAGSRLVPARPRGPCGTLVERELRTKLGRPKYHSHPMDTCGRRIRACTTANTRVVPPPSLPPPSSPPPDEGGRHTPQAGLCRILLLPLPFPSCKPGRERVGVHADGSCAYVCVCAPRNALDHADAARRSTARAGIGSARARRLSASLRWRRRDGRTSEREGPYGQRVSSQGAAELTAEGRDRCALVTLSSCYPESPDSIACTTRRPPPPAVRRMTTCYVDWPDSGRDWPGCLSLEGGIL